MSGLALLVV